MSRIDFLRLHLNRLRHNLLELLRVFGNLLRARYCKFARCGIFTRPPVLQQLQRLISAPSPPIDQGATLAASSKSLRPKFIRHLAAEFVI